MKKSISNTVLAVAVVILLGTTFAQSNISSHNHSASQHNSSGLFATSPSAKHY